MTIPTSSILDHPTSIMTLVVVVLSISGLVFVTVRIMVNRKTLQQEIERQRKERIAKASFRVRRSNLMSISGRGGRGSRGSRGGGSSGRRSRGSDSRGGKNFESGENNSKCNAGNSDNQLNVIFGALFLFYSKLISFLWKIIFSRKISSNSDNGTGLSKGISNSSRSKQSMEGYYDNVLIVGLDCEMVGGGRGGVVSLLARCSVVTLDHIPIDNTSKNNESKAPVPPKSLDENLIVLYDKYVIPKGKITDYRTQWSGITKEILFGDRHGNGKRNQSTISTSSSGGNDNQSDSDNEEKKSENEERHNNEKNSIPVVSFEQCQNEILQLFSSTYQGGKRVIVVGHAVSNDFEALRIKHPASLTRDTASFRPYMRPGMRKILPRKLSVLTSEELDIEIQQQQFQNLQNEIIGSNGSNSTGAKKVSSMGNQSMIGHSSVEDAAAALRLYWHKCIEWEHSLGYPLKSWHNVNIGSNASNKQCDPLVMYLDTCNLPMKTRGVDFKKVLGSDQPTNIPISKESFQLISRTSHSQAPGYNHTSSTIDWVPSFRAALLPDSTPKLESIIAMFDGAKFRDITRANAKKIKDVDSGEGERTRVFCVESDTSSNSHETSIPRNSIKIEITKDGDSADDVLFDKCCNNNTGSTIHPSDVRIISLNEAVDMLSSESFASNSKHHKISHNSIIHDTSQNDILTDYILIRRKSGGPKTHRRIFDKLHLRRPNEGALCLSGLTAKLQRDSWRIAKELQRHRGMDGIIECELRKRDTLRYVVVTDDVFLTDRLVGCGGVIVLSYRQLENFF